VFPASHPAPARSALTRAHLLVLAGLVIGGAILHAWVAATAPLSGDEAYYWLWSRRLQLSYFDHPGMSAWWIAAATEALGESTFAIRLPSVIGAALVTLLVFDTTRIAFDDPRAGLWAAGWLNVTILFGAAAIIATPDTPLLVFWALALWAMIRLVRLGQAVWLYLLGAALGLGFTGKYTMVLIAPGLLATFLLFRPTRAWLHRLHLPAAAGLGLALTLPVVVWNWQHDWVSFRKQMSHAFDAPVSDPVASVGTFVATQVGVVTPLILGFAVWGMGWALWAGWRRRRPDWFVLGACSAPVLAFFVHHAWGGIVQPHWAGPAYLGAISAAVGGWWSLRRPVVASRARRAAEIAFTAAPVVGIVLLALVYFQTATALLPIPARSDPIGRLGGWDDLARVVERGRRDHPDAFLFATKHEVSGLLAFHLADHPTVFLTGSAGMPRIPSYDRDDLAGLVGRTGIYVVRAGTKAVDDVARHFDKMTRLDGLDRQWGGRRIDHYEVWLAEGYRPGLFDDKGTGG